MNTLDALRLMVRNYPGGIEAVAVRIDKPAKTLEKELRNEPGHKLGLLVAELISTVCIEANSPQCRAFVNSIASQSGGFVQLEVREAGKQDLRVGMASMLKECSDAISELTMALADDRLSDNERRRIDRELVELIEQIQIVKRGVSATHAASKPALVAA